MDKEIMDIAKSLGVSPREFAPWRLLNPVNRERFKPFFEGDYSLSKEPALRGLNERDLEMRRRATEFAMGNMLQEAVATGKSDAAAFLKWALPMTRKYMPRFVAFDIADVRSVPLPSFPLHTLDHQYASSGGAYAIGTSIYDHFDPDYADDPGEATEPKKIKAKITSTTQTVVAKKLLADYSIEGLQDFQAYYGYNLRSEMVDVLSEQVLRERNAEILAAMEAAATTNTNWDDDQPVTPDPWSNATPKEYLQSLWDAICDANKEIFTRVFEDGNVLVCGSNFASLCEKVDGFTLSKTSATEGEIQTGPINIGVLKGRMKVYKDPDFNQNKAILVHKNSNWLKVGLAHCVYVPAWISPEIPEKDFTFAQGVMSRYVNVTVRGDFFATITIV